MNHIYHETIGGGYAMGPRITIDTAEIAPGEYETMALNEVTGDELAVRTATTAEQAKQDFLEILKSTAEPLQAAAYSAGMEPGKRYTILSINDFGYPTSQKITFLGMKCTTYAQHRGVVEIKFKPYRRKHIYKWYIYDRSFAIFEGWQDLPEEVWTTTEKDTGEVKITRWKYSCFDSRFFEDCKKALKNPLVIYEDYKRGVNGKLYA